MKNKFKIFIYSCFGFMVFLGCYEADSPRMPSTLDENSQITSIRLAPYSLPSCNLDENTMSCSFLNHNYSNIVISKNGRKRIVASEKDNPDNKITINFYNLLNQDGNYTIIGSGDLHIGEVFVTMEGNKFSDVSLLNSCYEGILYLKQTPSGYDLVICNSKFKYELNSVKYDGQFSAHFVVPK